MTGHEVLRDAGGRVVADYTVVFSGGENRAEHVRAADGVPDADVAAALRRELPGWEVSASEGVGLALVAAGAVKVRHMHCYTWDLATRGVDPGWLDPQLPPGLSAVPAVDREAADLTAAWLSAYPPGHPDNPAGETFDSARAQLATLYDGTLIGALMPCGVVIQDGPRPVAACLANDRPGTPPLGGPWVTEVFRDPDPAYAGLGATALRLTLARAHAAGTPALGLTVTEGNPARRTYEKLGFTH
ncbi:MAG: GNAT family N-acetyltransferase, partial [Streptomycetaceae bacterium]|nr:GNAT family N-acetyltransferase [Streptomycetaceae bacterium]